MATSARSTLTIEALPSFINLYDHGPDLVRESIREVKIAP